MCKSILFLLLFVTVSVSAKEIPAEIQKIIQKSSIPSKDLGLIILKVGEGAEDKPFFELNSTNKMVPASLSKILTAIGAFKTFLPTDRFATELQSDAKIKNGELPGALYLKGRGDSSFVSENMWVLVNNFKRNGVTKITGPIYVDDNLFDQEYFDKSRQSLRVDRAYDSPVSSVSFNWNSVNVYVRPTEKGQPAIVYVDPKSDYFEVINKVKTVSGGASDISISLKTKEQGEVITISGSIGVNSFEVVKYASIQTPYVWVGKNLIQFLSEAGITVENKNVLRSIKSIEYKKLAEAKGWSVFEMIDGMMKYSNNFIAEMLTKAVAIKSGHPKGSIDGGISVIQKVLETYGLKAGSYSFVSPSGFSNNNQITPQQFGNLLKNVYKDFTISSYLLSSFASPQSEGTLSKRMTSLNKPLLARGKTGLLSGVTGLAGYFSNPKNEVFAYVFIYNGSGKEAEARGLFDRLVVEMVEE